MGGLTSFLDRTLREQGRVLARHGMQGDIDDLLRCRHFKDVVRDYITPREIAFCIQRVWDNLNVLVKPVSQWSSLEAPQVSGQGLIPRDAGGGDLS